MATATSMQTVLSSQPISSFSSRINRSKQFPPAANLPRLQRNSNTTVRCMGKEPQESRSSSKVSTNFTDLFAFSGPAPERINGRLAMIGFVAALAVELSKGEDLFTQISNGGVSWFLATSVVLSLASLIPFFKGISVESKSKEIMSSDAELWNGRFAMLGLVALALTEYVKGGTLV